jgi:regulatory protein
VKITDIKPQKLHADRDSVYIDGLFAFGLDHETTLELKLAPGLELTPAQVDEILSEVSRKRAMDAALGLLSYRARSRKEIAGRLKRRGFSAELVELTCARLGELGLLNDRQFAESVARERLVFTGKGPRHISAELRRKGIPQPLIQQALEQAGDEEDAARAVLAKVSRRYAGLDPRKRLRKLHDLLLRRGFSFEVVGRVLAQEERQAAETFGESD